MAKIKTVDRTIIVAETVEEINTLISTEKWLQLKELHRHIYEFVDKIDKVDYINIIVNRDYIVEIIPPKTQ